MVWGAEIPPRSRRRRRAAAGLVALLAGALLVPFAGGARSRAASTTTIGASVESWYFGPGTQSAPVYEEEEDECQPYERGYERGYGYERHHRCH